MPQLKLIAIILVGFFVISSGCTSYQDPYKSDDPSQTPGMEEEIIESNHVKKNDDDSRLIELENKINSLQQQIDELETRTNRVDLLQPSKKNLIPNIPFKIRVEQGKLEPSITYTFNANGEVEIEQGDEFDRVRYKIYPETNTIDLISQDNEILDLVLYETYITGTYENGWIAWVYKYQTIPL